MIKVVIINRIINCLSSKNITLLKHDITASAPYDVAKHEKLFLKKICAGKANSTGFKLDWLSTEVVLFWLIGFARKMKMNNSLDNNINTSYPRKYLHSGKNNKLRIFKFVSWVGTISYNSYLYRFPWILYCMKQQKRQQGNFVSIATVPGSIINRIKTI